LGQYLATAFEQAGAEVDLVDALASKPFKLWPVLKSMRLNADAMWKARWENLIFCSSAWRRNTKRNGRLLARVTKPVAILQVGGIYAPGPEFRQTDYCVLVCNTTKLSLAEKVKPWVPRPEEREPFIALEQDVYRHARHVFTNAAYVKKHLAEQYGVPEERMTVTGLGVDRFFLENPPAEVAAELRHNLLFVGWDFGYKGGADLLAAFRAVRKVLPTLTLTVVGPDPAQHEPLGLSLHSMVYLRHAGAAAESVHLLVAAADRQLCPFIVGLGLHFFSCMESRGR
jgi:glycosyltransferase involved in cell wall biosynthesis